MRSLLLLTGFLTANLAVAEILDTHAEASNRHVLKVVPAAKEVVAIPALADCKVFMRPNGHIYRVIDNKVIRAGGHCPSNYVDGKLLGTNEIEILKSGDSIEGGHRICKLTNNGGCAAIRFLDNSVIPSSTIFDVTFHAADRSKNDVYVEPGSQDGNILQVGPPSDLIKFYAGDWSSCRILYVPDGTPYTRKGKLAAVSGKCPPHRFVPAKMLGHNEVQILNIACKLSDDGNCIKQTVVSSSLPPIMPNDGTTW